VTVPPLRRTDVTREVDLIEEVARIDGLERLPATLPARRGAAGLLTHPQRVRRAAEDLLTGQGLDEVVGWSFTEPGLLDRLRLPADDQMRQVVELENPLSEDQSIMRPSLLGSLLDVARHNVARNGPDVSIFESGSVYRVLDRRVAPVVGEHHALGVLLTGALTGAGWRGQAEDADFFAAKALLEALAARLHIELEVVPARWPFLHPGRSGDVILRGEEQPLGFIGEVHPLVAGSWDLGRTAVFSVDLGRMAAAAPEVTPFRPFGSFPSLRQDVAVTLPVGVPAGQLLEVVRGAAGELLESVRIFDVYAGEQVGEGRRSLALALSFRAPDRTLTDDDVVPIREAVVAAVAQLGGELRG
jgi:phenylalanyl-tRNA synthetase beta chain